MAKHALQAVSKRKELRQRYGVLARRICCVPSCKHDSYTNSTVFLCKLTRCIVNQNCCFYVYLAESQCHAGSVRKQYAPIDGEVKYKKLA